MSPTRNEANRDATNGVLLAQVREVADAGDRWFLSAAFRAQRAGTWVRREMIVIGDSAKAAWQTTMEVTRKVAPLPGMRELSQRQIPPRSTVTAAAAGKRRPSSVHAVADEVDLGEGELLADLEDAAWGAAAGRTGDEPFMDGPTGEQPTGGRRGLSVLDATPAVEAIRRPGGDGADLPFTAVDAPKIPLLLRFLGVVVAEHRHRGYEALEDDGRFWKLVDLLHNTRQGEPK